MENSCYWSTSIHSWISGNNNGRLNSFQGGLDFTCAPVSLHRLFYETALNNGPKSRRHRWPQRFGHFAQDCRTDLKGCVPSKRQLSRDRFIKHYSESP